MLRQKCAPQPLAIRTAAGGRKTARTRRMMLDCRRSLFSLNFRVRPAARCSRCLVAWGVAVGWEIEGGYSRLRGS